MGFLVIMEVRERMAGLEYREIEVFLDFKVNLVHRVHQGFRVNQDSLGYQDLMADQDKPVLKAPMVYQACQAKMERTVKLDVMESMDKMACLVHKELQVLMAQTAGQVSMVFPEMMVHQAIMDLRVSVEEMADQALMASLA